MRLPGKSCDVGNLHDWPIPDGQQLACTLDAPLYEIAVGWTAHGSFERLAKMMGAESGEARQICQRDFVAEMRLDEIDHAPKSRWREAAPVRH